MFVSSLAFYPIKSCRGHAVPAITLDRLGVVDDRRLMLVDAEGRFLSQREVPRLATLVPSLDGPTLEVHGPGRDPLMLELDPDGPIRSVSVWAKTGLRVNDQGDAAARWFSAAIEQPCRLVRFGAETRNPVDPEFSPRPEVETAFTDGYPTLIVVAESLEALNRQLSEPVPMGRFRPNIVVGGAEAWSEDTWRELEVGEVTFDAVKPCGRCVMTTTDQATGVRHDTREPLATLKARRMHPRLGGIFGQNSVPRAPGVIRVGDEVRITATRPRPEGLGIL